MCINKAVLMFLQRLSTESKRLPRVEKSQCGEKKTLGCSSKSEILSDAKISFVFSLFACTIVKMVELNLFNARGL